MATYTVKSGDTLSKIGNTLGVDWKKITGYKSGDPNIIQPGEILTLPENETPTTQTQPKPLTQAPGYQTPTGSITQVQPQVQPQAPTASQGYKIQPGDTLSAIAMRMGFTVSDLIAANPQITDPNKI